MTSDLISLFRRMLVIRHFEEKCLELSAEGFYPGSVHTSTGQEASPSEFAPRSEMTTGSCRPTAGMGGRSRPACRWCDSWPKSCSVRVESTVAEEVRPT